MRRHMPITGFAACLDTPAYAHRLLDLQGYTRVAKHKNSPVGMQRCEELYVEGWRQQENGQLRAALELFQELALLGRYIGHSGWINAVDSAIQFVTTEIVVEEAIAPFAPEVAHGDLGIARLLAKACSLRTQGYGQQAMEIYQEALQNAVEGQDVLSTARCLNNMGLLCLDWQQYDKAEVYCRTATEALSEIEAPVERSIAFHNQGVAHFQQKHFEAALRCFQQALNHWQAVEDTVGVAVTLDYLGRVYAENHAYWLALGSFEAAIDVLNEFCLEDDIQDEAVDLMEQVSTLCAKTRHFDLALVYRADALQIYQMQQEIPEMVETCCHLSYLYQQMGYDAIAFYYLRQAALLDG